MLPSVQQHNLEATSAAALLDLVQTYLQQGYVVTKVARQKTSVPFCCRYQATISRPAPDADANRTCPWGQLAGKIDQLLSQQTTYFHQGAQAMATLQDAINQLKAQVAANKSAIDSAKDLINGFGARLDAATAAAKAAGATDAQLQSLTDLSTAIKADDDGLAAAVVANTPAATPPPSPTPAPTPAPAPTPPAASGT